MQHPERIRRVLRSRAFIALLIALCASRFARAQTVVTGMVRDSAGFPLANVDIEVSPLGLHVRSGDRGTYRVTGALTGAVSFTARRLGFQPATHSLSVDGRSVLSVDFVLRAPPEILRAVNVTARPEVYDSRLAGFNARSKQGVGHFVTRERIDRANSATLSDVLREVPGVHIGAPRNEGRAIRLRGSSCAPLVFVDGFPATAGEFDVDIIDLKSVEGIEVYAGLGALPPEFSGPRDLDRCGVIAIWSRPARARNGEALRLAGGGERSPLPVADEAVLTQDEVDQAARLDNGGAVPHYPDSLLALRVRGRVVVEFVVDTMGAVERGSIAVLSSTNELFTASVREALSGSHFFPARKQGRRVRQFMQLPFNFTPPG